MLMLHTGDRKNDVKSVPSVSNEMGLGGLNEVATGNERLICKTSYLNTPLRKKKI